MPSVDVDSAGAAGELAQALAVRPELRQELRTMLDEADRSEQNKPRRYIGRIRTFNAANGYGFIDCPELLARTRFDVFLHKNQYQNQPPGSRVTFSINMNNKGQPQAMDVQTLDDHSYCLEGQAAPARPSSSSAVFKPFPASMAVPGTSPGSIEGQLTPEAVSEYFHCSICQEIYHRPTACAPCMHLHCSSCLGRWLQTKRECPVCRAHVTAVKQIGWVDELLKLLLGSRIAADLERSTRCTELDGQDPLRKAGYNLDKLPYAARCPFDDGDFGDSLDPPWPVILTPYMWDRPGRPAPSPEIEPTWTYPARPSPHPAPPPRPARTRPAWPDQGWWYAASLGPQ